MATVHLSITFWESNFKWIKCSIYWVECILFMGDFNKMRFYHSFNRDFDKLSLSKHCLPSVHALVISYSNDSTIIYNITAKSPSHLINVWSNRTQINEFKAFYIFVVRVKIKCSQQRYLNYTWLKNV